MKTTPLIAIVGASGVGKTSLARALAQTADLSLGLEQHAERPFQSLFKNDRRYALATKSTIYCCAPNKNANCVLQDISDWWMAASTRIFTGLHAFSTPAAI